MRLPARPDEEEDMKNTGTGGSPGQVVIAMLEWLQSERDRAERLQDEGVTGDPGIRTEWYGGYGNAMRAACLQLERLVKDKIGAYEDASARDLGWELEDLGVDRDMIDVVLAWLGGII